MKFPPFEFLRPLSVAEACEVLAEEGARPLAGGQSLLPLMALRLARPQVLVDITRLDALGGIALEPSNGVGSVLSVGATTTHGELQESGLVRSVLPVLAEVASHIGHQAILHLGTIGGSIVHADPAAE